MPVRYKRTNNSGFTVLELLVAVSVTALLAGMLLNITSQVVSTQTKASSDLETNQVAQFILDRIQEDLHCAVFRNDGNVWMELERQLAEGGLDLIFRGAAIDVEHREWVVGCAQSSPSRRGERERATTHELRA